MAASSLALSPFCRCRFDRLVRSGLSLCIARCFSGGPAAYSSFWLFCFWLNLLLSFFGLRDPLIASIEAVLNANLAIGSFNVTLGDILAFLITVWVSFLISKFLRFVLEEDVYDHFHLPRGVPYAISLLRLFILSWFRPEPPTAFRARLTSASAAPQILTRRDRANSKRSSLPRNGASRRQALPRPQSKGNTRPRT